MTNAKMVHANANSLNVHLCFVFVACGAVQCGVIGCGANHQVPGGVESLTEAEKGRCKIAKDADGKEVVTVCSGEEAKSVRTYQV